MSRYRFELVTLADDADLRRILSATPMQGSLAISFRREPSYFEAAVVEGRFRQVVAARDTHTGHLVGFGARSISERFVHGEAIPIGYLSSRRLRSPCVRIFLSFFRLTTRTIVTWPTNWKPAGAIASSSPPEAACTVISCTTKCRS